MEDLVIGILGGRFSAWYFYRKIEYMVFLYEDLEHGILTGTFRASYSYRNI